MRFLALIGITVAISGLAQADDTMITSFSVSQPSGLQALEKKCPAVDKGIGAYASQNKVKVERILSLQMTEAALAQPGMNNSFFSDRESGTKLFSTSAEVLLENNEHVTVALGYSLCL